MDYHIFDTYTLKSMGRDINKEIHKLTERLEKLKEQKDFIDILIKYRNQKEREITYDNDVLINPLD
jgi:hypothetical protein